MAGAFVKLRDLEIFVSLLVGDSDNLPIQKIAALVGKFRVILHGGVDKISRLGHLAAIVVGSPYLGVWK